ncbi:type II toxin-antitoxin system VapC family toxin [Micromonospora echinaurantiaca]|uniref:type II toxin-antitoxin system VapC family toxin n=1 Tax=Micromonospora echinaurantiaca TaxID=47857 RepID=UPI00343C8420
MSVIPRQRSAVIVDTGPLVALINNNDEHHAACAEWLETILARRRTLVIPMPIVTEVCYLLAKTAGSGLEAMFLEELARTPAHFSLFTLGRSDFARMASLIRKYADLPLGIADAAVVVTAERFNTTEIATIDHRMAKVVKVNDRDPIVAVP